MIGKYATSVPRGDLSAAEKALPRIAAAEGRGMDHVLLHGLGSLMEAEDLTSALRARGYGALCAGHIEGLGYAVLAYWGNFIHGSNYSIDD